MDCRVPLFWSCCCAFVCWCQSHSVCAGSHSCKSVRCGRTNLSDVPSNRHDLGMSPSMLYKANTRVSLHSTAYSLRPRERLSVAFLRVYTPHLSIHEAIFRRLHQFLHRIGLPPRQSRWRPVCHEGSSSSSTYVSGFLRPSFSFIIRIILSTMSCVFF